MLALLTVLAGSTTSTLPTTSALVKPTPKTNTKTVIDPGVKPQVKLHDRVATIPPVPSGLNIVLLSPAEFHASTSDGAKLVRYTGSVEGLSASRERETTALASFRVPVGATVAWVDCRVDVRRGQFANELDGKLAADVAVTRVDYERSVTDEHYSASLASMKIKLTREDDAMHWKGMPTTKQQASGPGDMYSVRVLVRPNKVDAAIIRGCRIGYRP